MIIENLESLKSWLIQTLTPICDADPDTLAKYVIALVKKDKPLDELKDSCFRELDVFLQDNTKSFVSRLFDALETKSYVSDHAAKNYEIPGNNPPPKEVPGTRQRTPDNDLKSAQPSDRRTFSEAPSRDGPLQPSRNLQRGSFYEGSKTQDRHRDVDYRRSSERRRGALQHLSRSAREEQNFQPVHRPDGFPGGVEHREFDNSLPRHMNELRNHRPRTSSLPRRADHWTREGLHAAVSQSSLQDKRRADDRHRRFFSPGKAFSSNASSAYNSPARSPRSESTFLSQNPWDERRQRSDSHERYSQPLHCLRSPNLNRRSRTRSRTSSRTPSRSVDRGPFPRASRSRSRTPRARSRTGSLSERSSRSRSPKFENKEPVINSRSSTPLEEEEYRVSEPPRLKIRYDPQPPPSRPRCTDYDEKGFCIRGDLCEFDHGNDPVIIDSIKVPFPPTRLSEPGGPSLPPPLPLHGPPLMAPMPHMPRAMPHLPYPDPQTLLPPPLQLQDRESGASYLPPPHLMPSMPQIHGMDLRLFAPQVPPQLRLFPLMPPPPFGGGSRPLTMRPEAPRSISDLYQPPVMMPVEPYIPEPYSPKSPTFQPKLDENWETVSGADVSFAPKRVALEQIAAGRHSNLVRVPTDEVPHPVEKTAETSVTSVVHAGVKRSAKDFDAPSSDSASFGNGSQHPPPAKKTAFEHPGVRHGNTNNTTLELRKIPREQNTIASINNHFSKFGIIVNLQVGWDGDPQAALVSFASNAQAQLAYRSQEPFLNNRFIKIFWHNAEKPSQSQVPSAPTAEAPKQRIVIPERHKLQLNNTLKNVTQAAKSTKMAAALQTNVAVSVKPAEQKTDAKADSPVTPSSGNADTKPLTSPAAAATPTAADKPAPEASQERATKLLRQTSKESHDKELLQKRLELRKKLQELLTGNITQQKILFEKLEKDKSNLTAEERLKIIDTIKKLAKTIEDLKKSLNTMMKLELSSKTVPANANTPVTSSAPSIPARGSLRKINTAVRSTNSVGKVAPSGAKSPQILALAPVFQDGRQAQKAILDAEMDLMNRQKEGTDAAELLKRVVALKEEAASLGLLGPTPGVASKQVPLSGRGRGSVPGHGRGGRRWPTSHANTTHVVDRRPRQLLITGFLAEEKDELIAHLRVFGELESSAYDRSVPSLSVCFKSRLHAEKAATDGCNFNGKKLKMMWQKAEPNKTESNGAENVSDPTEKINDKSLKEIKDVSSDVKQDKISAQTEDILKPDVGQMFESGAKLSPDKIMEKVARLDSITGEEDEFDEEMLLSIDDEDDDDNESGRPWRR